MQELLQVLFFGAPGIGALAGVTANVYLLRKMRLEVRGIAHEIVHAEGSGSGVAKAVAWAKSQELGVIGMYSLPPEAGDVFDIVERRLGTRVLGASAVIGALSAIATVCGAGMLAWAAHA